MAGLFSFTALELPAGSRWLEAASFRSLTLEEFLERGVEFAASYWDQTDWQARYYAGPADRCPEVVTAYPKLSAALLAGVSLVPNQARGSFWRVDPEATCALGAIHDATFGRNNRSAPLGVVTNLVAPYPQLREIAAHPVEDVRVTRPDWVLAAVINNLNEMCDYSREQIAGWLESIGQ